MDSTSTFILCSPAKSLPGWRAGIRTQDLTCTNVLLPLPPESIDLVRVGPPRGRRPCPTQLRERRRPGHHGGPGQADAGARAPADRVGGGGGRVKVVTPTAPQSTNKTFLFHH